MNREEIIAKIQVLRAEVNELQEVIRDLRGRLQATAKRRVGDVYKIADGKHAGVYMIMQAPVAEDGKQFGFNCRWVKQKKDGTFSVRLQYPHGFSDAVLIERDGKPVEQSSPSEAQ